MFVYIWRVLAACCLTFVVVTALNPSFPVAVAIAILIGIFVPTIMRKMGD